MKLEQKIGVVGNGFVGGAVKFGFSPQTGCDAEVRVYDKNPNKSTHEDGSINISILESALGDINEVHNGKDNSILIRSTVIPGTTWALQQKYPQLNILFNPEFLTERSANFDFINQSRFIVGNNGQQLNQMKSEQFVELIKDRFGDCVAVMETSYETAELIKYMNNCFFATKVSFMNEMYQIAEKIDANWDEAVSGFVSDGRIGHSHLGVPGHDGKFGFGGSCFPKDIQAMINFGESNGVDMKVLKGAWEKNLEVRPEQDWKDLKGRAVTDD